MRFSPAGFLRLIQGLVLLVMLLPVSGVSGQKPFFRSVKVPDEFQQTSITCLYQDRNSYLWIGTGKGLYKYDGNDFVYYPGVHTREALQVSALYMSPDNVLWIGTRKGDIYRLTGDSIQLFNPEEGNPKVAITGFASDNQGNLWFSTYGEGLYYFNHQHIYNLNTDDGLTDNYCYTITPDELGRLWAATDGGISICSIVKGKHVIRKISTAESLPDNIVLSLTSDNSGMWAGLQDAGICYIDKKSLTVSVPKASTSWQYGQVNNIVSGQNWLWLSTERNGIIGIQPSSGNIIGNYLNSDNMNISRVSRMYSDKQGNFWIASGSQLFLSLGYNLLHYAGGMQMKSKNIYSILHDSKNKIWYSTDDGLFTMDLLTGNTVKINIPLKSHTHFISLFEDSRGNVWSGTFGSGLFCIQQDGKRIKLFHETDGLTNENILSITGRGNQMWLATLGGAFKCDISGDPFDNGSEVSFTNYGDQHFPGNNYIYSVFIDSHNRVWFGTDGKGISMLEKGRFVIFDKAQGLKSDIIYSITEDSDGDIWFSTANAGVYRYNGKKFRNYSAREGLSDLNITGLLADKEHHILVIHNNGVDILDTRKNIFLYYNSGIGLSEINPDLNVCSLEGKNIAWLGTQNGFIRLQVPKDISVHQPSLQLDMVSVFLGRENFINTHVFPYNQNHISFHFNALWYMAPAQVRYQVSLTGYDLNWIETRDNLVTYSSLPPGNYTFKVRSAINGNFSMSEIKSFTFTIKKPFWKTYPFIIISLLCVILLVFFIIKFREKTLKQRDALEREKIMFQFQTLRSQVNPHFLFNSFSTLISIIDENKDIAIEYVEKLSKFFRDILDYREKDLIPLSEELQLIDTYYYLQKKRYCQNLSLETSVGEKERQSLIPPMVLQMLVENAIKHNVVSVEKPLAVRIFTDSNHIIVSNSLQLKKSDVPSTGLGLTNIRNRYILLGFGEIVIETSVNEFIVKLPLIYPGK